jgi:hypothetical protein
MDVDIDRSIYIYIYIYIYITHVHIHALRPVNFERRLPVRENDQPVWKVIEHLAEEKKNIAAGGREGRRGARGREGERRGKGTIVKTMRSQNAA